MSIHHFAKNCTQSLTADEELSAYRRSVVPTPARFVFDFLLDRGIVVSFGNPRHPPLLLVATEIDRAVPTTIGAPTSAGTWHARQRPSSI